LIYGFGFFLKWNCRSCNRYDCLSCCHVSLCITS
jgi:hypothetical protein